MPDLTPFYTFPIEKPDGLHGGVRDYNVGDIEWVVSQFQIAAPAMIAPFPGKGNINLHTYEVVVDGVQYLLQKVNSEVFTMPYRVMSGMTASLAAQKASMERAPVDGWVPIELIPTRTGEDFLDLTDEHGWSVWRLMVRIPDSVCYKSLSELPTREKQLETASEVGRGLAIYSDLTSTINPDQVDGSLVGYRDTALYYKQFYSVLAQNRTLADAEEFLPKDILTRTATATQFLVVANQEEFMARMNDTEIVEAVAIVKKMEPFAMGLWTAIEEGSIRKTLIHGDTKIENFLFCAQTGKVKSLVDLDTIMPFTWLADWGDMLRSMVNVAGEKERDLSKVVVDKEIYSAVTSGFLSAAKEVTSREVSLMVQAVQAITLELGLRFLTDYLRGDNYFQLLPTDEPELNKVRALVQIKLYQELAEFAKEVNLQVANLA
jgi:hypothetical protein